MTYEMKPLACDPARIKGMPGPRCSSPSAIVSILQSGPAAARAQPCGSSGPRRRRDQAGMLDQGGKRWWLPAQPRRAKRGGATQ
jgi:hypothetical protein